MSVKRWLHISLLWALAGFVAPAPAQDGPHCTLRVTGRIITADGRGIAGAQIETGFMHLLGTGTPTCAMVPVAADGTFAVVIRCAQSMVRTSRAGVLLRAKGRASVRFGANIAPFNGLTGGPSHQTHALGDVVLAPGRELRGQVLGHKGQPLASAIVRAVRVVDLNRFFPFQAAAFAATTAEADDRFKLRGVADGPLALLVDAPGHYDGILTVVDPNLMAIVTLKKSGYLTGRVIRAKNQPTRGTVFIDYQGYMPGLKWEYRSRRTQHDSHHPGQVVDTAADGTFRATVRYPGFFRVRARGARMWHEVVEEEARSGPGSGLELELPASAGEFLTVRVRDAAGKPIAGAWGASFWRNVGARAHEPSTIVLASGYETLTADGKGVLRLPGPSADRGDTGIAQVVAKGYAPRFLTKLKWPAPGKRSVPVTLVRESVVEGRLRGPATHVGGVLISATLAPTEEDQRRSVPRPVWRTHTNGQGHFEIRGLAAGSYTIGVPYRQRYLVEPIELDVAAGEKKTAVTLRFKPVVPITGNWSAKTAPPAACRLELGRGASPKASWFPKVASIPIPADGALDLGAHPAGHYRVSLISNDAQRPHMPVRVVLASFELGDRDPKLKIELPAPTFATVRGSVEVTGVRRLPFHRFVVAAVVEPPTPLRSPMAGSNPRAQLSRWPHAPVRPDGTFALRVAKGRYHLRLVDAATGIEVHRSKILDMTAGGVVRVELKPTLARITIVLVGAGKQAAECTSLRVELHDTPKDPPPEGRFARFARRESGTGIWVGHRPGQIELFLPPGRVSVEAIIGLAFAFERRPDVPKNLGKHEFIVRDGKSVRIELRVASVSDDLREVR